MENIVYCQRLFEPEEGWVTYKAEPNGKTDLKYIILMRLLKKRATRLAILYLLHGMFLNGWYDWSVIGAQWDMINMYPLLVSRC